MLTLKFTNWMNGHTFQLLISADLLCSQHDTIMEILCPIQFCLYLRKSFTFHKALCREEHC
jgi:hypothetical protein